MATTGTTTLRGIRATPAGTPPKDIKTAASHKTPVDRPTTPKGYTNRTSAPTKPQDGAATKGADTSGVEEDARRLAQTHSAAVAPRRPN
jgi:hypothetical protein